MSIGQDGLQSSAALEGVAGVGGSAIAEGMG